jgi:hypothetical protein
MLTGLPAASGSRPMPAPPTPDPPPPSRSEYRAYSGTGYVGADFRGIGGDLLKTFPPIAPPAPPPPAAIDPTAEGFGVCGPHLLSPILDGPDGARVAVPRLPGRSGRVAERRRLGAAAVRDLRHRVRRDRRLRASTSPTAED